VQAFLVKEMLLQVLQQQLIRAERERILKKAKNGEIVVNKNVD